MVYQATDIAIQTQHIINEQPTTEAPIINAHDLVKRRVLVMDDHEEVYLQLKQRFADLDVYWASSLEQAHEMLSQQTFAVALTDVSLGGENIAPIIYSLKIATLN